jgi:integrase
VSRRRDGLYKHRSSPNFYFKLKTENGWKEVAARTPDRAAAKKLRVAAEREAEEGRLPNDRSSWTLSAAIQNWLPDRQLRVSDGSFKSNRTHTGHLLRVLGDQTKLIKLATASVITNYQSTRLREEISPKSVNNEVLTLSSILQSANLWHRVVTHYKPLKVTKSDIGQALSRDSEQKLLQVAISADADAVAPYTAVLALRTFLRHKEVRLLRLKAIHLEGPAPYIQVFRNSTKTDSGARRVPLDRVAYWAVSRLLARARNLGATEPAHFLLPTSLERHTRKSDPLHGGTGHDPTHPQSSWDGEWETLKTNAGIPEARFHDLRHTGITRAAEAGVPLAVVQDMAGHFSAAMTRYYVHICDGALQNAMTRMEANSSHLLSLLPLRLPDDISADTEEIALGRLQ